MSQRASRSLTRSPNTSRPPQRSRAVAPRRRLSGAASRPAHFAAQWLTALLRADSGEDPTAGEAALARLKASREWLKARAEALTGAGAET
jgi:hypothetical protein